MNRMLLVICPGFSNIIFIKASSTSPRMWHRLMLNIVTEVRISVSESSNAHISIYGLHLLFKNAIERLGFDPFVDDHILVFKS